MSMVKKRATEKETDTHSQTDDSLETHEAREREKKRNGERVRGLKIDKSNERVLAGKLIAKTGAIG